MSRRPEEAGASAEEPAGYAVTVWVEGPGIRSQEEADALVGAMLDVARPGAPEGTTASVVPG